MPQSDSRMRIAEILLEIGAIRVTLAEPIKFVSGILSPIYCDNRLLLGHPEPRRHVIDGLTDAVRSGPGSVDCVAGTATAGIPHAAWVADRLALPMVYVRAEAKAHGKSKQIEGGEVRDRRVVVVEDLVTTGGSSLAAIERCEEFGLKVRGVLAIVDRLDGGAKNFAARGYPFDSLLTVRDLGIED